MISSKPSNNTTNNKGHSKKDKNSSSTTTTPLTRTRADTWETNLLLQATDEDAPPPSHQNSAEGCENPWIGNNNKKTNDPNDTPSALSSALNSSTPPSKQQQRSSSSSGSTSNNTHFTSTTAAAAASPASGLKHRHQEQWQLLWETQSLALVDPVDIPSVWDALVAQCINQGLSAVQMTLLQRKVRAVVRHQLPPSSNNGNINNSNNSANNSSHTNNSTTPSLDAAATTSAASKFAMLLSGGSSSNSHSQHHQLALEARVVLDKHRLLTASLVKRVLPVSPLADAIAVLALSLGNHNNSGVNVLMDRVLTAAVAAAQQTGLEMDVNKQMRKTTTATTGENAVDTAAAALDEIIFSTSSKSRSSTTKQHLQQQYAPKTAPNVLKNGYKMPIPSHVPELDEAVQEWPIGASFSSLAALIAMATTTTAAASSHPISKQNGIQEHANHNSSSSRRAQRLQLLFYCLMDARALKEFLATHPAGGIPVWLFEVGNSTVISLPSLTHYHYFGNAFLPCSTTPKSAYSKLGDAKSSPPAFVASKSRLPVTIDADRAQTCIRDALNRATLAVSRRTSLNGHAVNTNNSSQNGVNYPFDEVQTASPSPSKPIKDAMSMIVPMLPPISAFRKSSSTNDLQHSNAVSPASNNNDSSNHASLEHSMFPFSPLMRKIQQVSEGVKTELYCPVMDELENSIAQFETATASFLEHTDVDEWTLQEFKMWADGALDDIALNAVMHRFFAEGVLPSPALERDLITEKWLEWQKMIQQTKFDHTDSQVGAQPNLPGGQSGTDTLSPSVSSLPLSGSGSNGIEANGGAQGWSKRHTNLGAVWGGIGGIEGLGGTGYGILYCVPTAWWNVWAAYTGWSFMGDSSMPQTQGRLNSPRPDLLQNESLLEKESDLVIRGSLGSYEVMRRGLQRGKDYVLVPPGVWDILFELYSGGPPLPRMVNPLNDVWSSFRDATKFEKPSNVLTNSVADKQSDVRGYLDCNFAGQVLRLPDQVSIETHPLILHVHLCDPLQPYRRGDTGPMSIRVMTMPNQPIWRLYGEIICRFSFHSYKAFDSNGHGMARLWKKMESTGTKDGPDQRYGPWNLVCQSRHAILPLIKNGLELADDYEELLSDWKTYGDYETIESSCIVDNQGLLLEFAVQNKSGDLTWPREAAAKAGKVRRLADEDKKLRQLLQGVGDDGNMLLKPPSIIGLQVDAMDASGRWFTVRIVDSQIVDDDTDEENDDDDDLDIDDHKRMRQLSKKRVKVNFSDHGGHIEWIDVESDRIQTAGRFASEEEQQASLSPTNGNGVTGANGIDAKSKSAASAKRTSSNTDSSVENMKACMVPGFGACGLTNLGNTCYMNSAVQCMAYLPLLRAYLLSTQYKASGDLNKDNPLGTGGKLLEEFANLQRSMWGARLAEHTPNRFRGQLGKTNEQFSGADQQDAQEFLNYMIDVLHEDSNKVRKKPYVESLEDEWVEQTGLPRVGEEAWRR